jgi:hypothetical protein
MTFERREFLHAVLAGAVGSTFTYRGLAQQPAPSAITATKLADRLAQMIKAGKTVDETIAAKPSKEFDEKFGQGTRKPDAFVQVAYTSILRHQRIQ